MARGPDKRKAALPVQRPFRRGDCRSGSMGCNVVGMGIDIRILINITADKGILDKKTAIVYIVAENVISRVPDTLLAEPGQVTGMMDPFNILR
jgi:hypothetical protein